MDRIIPNTMKDKDNEQKNPEKKVYKGAVIDVEALVDSQSKDVGDTKMTESANDRSKNRVSKFFTRIWKHNLAQDYYRNKEISKTREAILNTGNLYEGEVDNGVSNMDHHKEAMNAIIDRFTSEYSNEILKEEERDSKKEGDSVLNNKIKELIKDYASSDMPEAAFIEEKNRLLFINNPSYGREDNLYADNLLDIAKEVKDSIAHQDSLADMDFDLDITLGKARDSLNTEAKKTTFDKIMTTMGKTRLGTLALNVGAGAIVAGAYSLTKFAATGLSKSGAKWLGFGAGLAAGAAIEGAKESVRIRRERSQHMRDSAKGVKFTGEDIERREQMDKNRYETKNATEIKNALDNSLELLSRGNLSNEEADSIMGTLSDLESRVRLGEERKIDLISYDSFDKVEKDRTDILIKSAELKVALRNSTHARHVNSEQNLESLINIQIDNLNRNEISTKDEVYKKLRKERIARKVAQTILIGGAASFAFQEVSSFFTKEDGVVEGAVKSIRNSISSTHEAGSDLSETTTSLEALRRWVLNDGPRMPQGNMVELQIENTNVHLPEGASIVQNIDSHGYGLTIDGKVIPGVEFNSQGDLTEESKELLKQSGIFSKFTQIDTSETQTVLTTPREYVDNHSDLTHRIHRDLWYENDTKPFDQNELRGWWGGESNTGINENGDYVFNMSHMTNDGSFHGAESIDAKDQINKGALKMVFSLSRDTQHQVFEVSINENGDAIIPKDSPIANLMFKQVDGHAVFTGKFAEVAQPMGIAEDGGENLRILATHIGLDKPNIEEVVPVGGVTPHIEFSIISPSEIEPPIPIPIAPRRPLERGEYEKDQDKKPGPANKNEEGIKPKIQTEERIKPVTSNVIDSIYAPDQGFSTDEKVSLNESVSKKDKIFQEFEDFVAANPGKPIPEDLESRYRLAEAEDVLDKNLEAAISREKEAYAVFEGFSEKESNIGVKVPEYMEEEYRQAEADLLEAQNAKKSFMDKYPDYEVPVANTISGNEAAPSFSDKEAFLNEINDEEYNNFVDNNVVSKDRIEDIARKIKSRIDLLPRELSIFTSRTSEINKIILES